MQTIGHIFNTTTGEKILILVRQSAKHYRSLKRRKTGKDGNHFDDEEYFLNEPEQEDRLNDLMAGKTITC